jgi:hypothetical protein
MKIDEIPGNVLGWIRKNIEYVQQSTEYCNVNWTGELEFDLIGGDVNETIVEKFLYFREKETGENFYTVENLVNFAIKKNAGK